MRPRWVLLMMFAVPVALVAAAAVYCRYFLPMN